SDLSLASANSPVALFPFIESGATVRNLNHAIVSITGAGNFIFVAPLAGENRGTISNVQVLSGTVSGGSQSGAAGGLAAQNKGLIQNSSSAANVSVGSNGIGGGLVGFNLGIIQNAFASGSVAGAGGTSGINSQNGSTTLGGLAGINQGLISGSSASGNIGSPNIANLQVGGLVGDNSGTILSSIAKGDVQAGSANPARGLVGPHTPGALFQGAGAPAYFYRGFICGSATGGCGCRRAPGRDRGGPRGR